jgi:hypothetical protein
MRNKRHISSRSTGSPPFSGLTVFTKEGGGDMHERTMRKAYLGTLLSLAVVFLILASMASPTPALAATTELTVTKYDPDGGVIDSQTVTYQWMEANLPVQGDGVTPYYCQGPTLDDTDLWNPDEDVNLKFYGAAKGTDVKDLANLVGGAAAGDTIQIAAPDGFSKSFDYQTVYHPPSRQGKLVVAWYNADFGGYVPSYDTGMRLLFFAGDHVFGDWDMHETLPESRWHFYKGIWPASSGLSVQNVSSINIYQGEAVGGIVELERDPPPLSAHQSDSSGPNYLVLAGGAAAALFALAGGGWYARRRFS